MPDLDDTPAPADSHEFWWILNDSVYEAVRASLDTAFGHPCDGVSTCIPPASLARHDAQGRPLLSLENSATAWPTVAAAREQLIAAGHAGQTTRAIWEAAAPAAEL